MGLFLQGQVTWIAISKDILIAYYWEWKIDCSMFSEVKGNKKAKYAVLGGLSTKILINWN